MPDHLPTGYVTFLFTDIEGSTRLWDSHPQAMQRALARHDALLHRLVQEGGGYVFKTIGDAFCSVFQQAPDALQTATAIQRALLEENWDPEIGTLKIRAALNSGVCDERKEGDYFGPVVNRVARLMAVLQGGQIGLSQNTFELVRSKLPEGVSLRDLGAHRLKDLSRAEHIYQVCAPGLPDNFGPVRSLSNLLQNLPVQTTSFVGRKVELERAVNLLRHSNTRLLTFTGTGGTGKTRLSLQVAAEVSDYFPDGVYFVPLSSISDPAAVCPAIAQVLEIKENAAETVLQTLQNSLKDKTLLIILDNFEQVDLAMADISSLLAAASRIKILITSRFVLRIYGEQEFNVPPLAFPLLSKNPLIGLMESFEPESSPASQYPALDLFLQRARLQKADFNLNRENLEAVAAICQKLDGLPLGIELAAARSKLFSPQAMLPRLENRLKFLSSGSRDLPQRQQTLRGAIDWSHDLLDETEKVLLRRLAIFEGSCAVEGAEKVCNPAGSFEGDVLNAISSLVDKSFLYQNDLPDGQVRLGMLDTIREYALEKLDEAGERELLEDSHNTYYHSLAYAASTRLTGKEQAEWFNLLEEEQPNLGAVIGRLLSPRAQDLPRVLEISSWLYHFWSVRGYFSQARNWIQTAISGSRGENLTPAQSRLLAKACNAAGILARDAGDLNTALAYLEESLLLLRPQDDKTSLSATLHTLSTVCAYLGDFARAEVFQTEALEIRRAIKDRRGIALSLSMLAAIAAEGNDYARARQYYNESLPLYRQLGEKRNLARALSNLGSMSLLENDLKTAARQVKESLELRQELGDKNGIATSQADLGRIHLAEGKLSEALTCLNRGIFGLAEIGAVIELAATLEATAATLAAFERGSEEAARLMGYAAAIREQSSAPHSALDLSLYRQTRATLQNKLAGQFEEQWDLGRLATLKDILQLVQTISLKLVPREVTI